MVCSKDGYNLVCADHPNNIKKGGVCIYYKESLPARVISLPYLREPLLLEMTYNNKKVIVPVIYCSPGQNNSEFDLFLPNFEKLLSDIKERTQFLSEITGDFSARSSSWWPKDIDATEGSKLFSLTSSDGFPQSINDPTHIQTSSSSCIDLIFTNQPNLSVNSGAHASLHPNFHHQIIHYSFNLNISYPHHINDLYGVIKKLIQKIFKKPLIL